MNKLNPMAPLPFRGGAGGGGCQDSSAFADRPHPNPSPEGEGLLVALIALSLIASPALAKPPPGGYQAALPAAAPAPRVADGSIFNAASGYAPLHEGLRARAIGDPVTIQLIENTTSSKSAASKTQRSGAGSIIPPAAFPFAWLNPESLKASSQGSFNGQGNATQTSSFSSELSVTIAEVRPNGTALLRGEKRMMLSQGQEWVQFSGIVRLADIDQDNRIASTRIADARLTYSGNGAVQRSAREGWLSRFFNMISPF